MVEEITSCAYYKVEDKIGNAVQHIVTTAAAVQSDSDCGNVNET